MTKVSINTDEFLVYDLHYALGQGAWNEGDGHDWIYDDTNLHEIEERIVQNFRNALEKFMTSAEELEDE